MKNLIPFLVIVLAACLVGSCEKESLTPVASSSLKINPTESYLINIQTKVLFASLKIDHQEQTINGWLINWKGELRKINNDFSISLLDEIVTDHTIEAIQKNSQWVATIDKEQLVRFHRLANKATILRDITTNTEASTSTAYVSYMRTNSSTAESHTGSDCQQDSATDSYSLPSYEQDLLVTSGKLNQQVASSEIQAVTDYLSALEVKVDF